MSSHSGHAARQSSTLQTNPRRRFLRWDRRRFGTPGGTNLWSGKNAVERFFTLELEEICQRIADVVREELG